MYTKQEYLELQKQIKRHNDLYYNQDNPEISDFEYDALSRKFKDMEKEHPEWVTNESPTQHVGGNTGKPEFTKVEHAVPMLSLQDVFSHDDVQDFINNFPKDTTYTVEPKIDGLSISATYKNGVLIRAETRGDGTIGEDITENARFINGIPTVLSPFSARLIPNLIEIRAEVYLPVSEFLKRNKEREETEEKPFSNPRNAAAGLLRTKDTNIVANAGLHAFVFNVQRIDDSNLPKGMQYKTHAERLRLCEILGFTVIDRMVCDKEDVIKFVNYIGNNRPADYWIDGAVIKIDDLYLREQCGETNKYPRWAIAYKYPPEEKTTILRDIILQTGRTGRVTPVAKFDTIDLGGSHVSSATLHNPAHIKKLDIRIGDTIVVQKAAEIIPEIVRVINDKRPTDTKPFIMDQCPECKQPLEISDDGTSCTCTNPSCPAQFSRYIEFVASKDVLNIDGLGPAQIAAFIENGWLTSLPDVFNLKDHRDQIALMNGYGYTSTDKLLKAIHKAKDNNIDRLIKAFGIPGVGRHIGRILAKAYPDINAIANLTIDELIAHKGIGDTTAHAIVKWFSDPNHRQMIAELDTLSVNLRSKTYNHETEGSLSGLTFVITGTLQNLTRDEAKALIETNGGKVSSSISKNTSYLLAGENAGNKLEKANALGTRIINETELYNMINKSKD